MFTEIVWLQVKINKEIEFLCTFGACITGITHNQKLISIQFRHRVASIEYDVVTML